MRGVALSLAVLCSAERSDVVAREATTGLLTGRVHVVAHPARRLATAGAYPGRIVGIQNERDTSELDNVIVFVNSPMRVDSGAAACVHPADERRVRSPRRRRDRGIDGRVSRTTT